MSTDPTFSQIVREGHEAFLRLAAAVAQAEEIQWQPAPVPKPRTEGGGQAKGGAPADPTADIVLDARRLVVRHAVKVAVLMLRRLTQEARQAEARVNAAIDHWTGFRPDTVDGRHADTDL